MSLLLPTVHWRWHCWQIPRSISILRNHSKLSSRCSFFQQRLYLITIFLDFGEIWSLHVLKCPFEFYLFHRFCFSLNHRPVPLVGNILHGAQIVFHYIQNAMHYFHLFYRISNKLGDPIRWESAHAANIGKMFDPSLGLQMPEKLGPSFNTVKLRTQYSQYPF